MSSIREVLLELRAEVLSLQADCRCGNVDLDEVVKVIDSKIKEVDQNQRNV